MYNGLLHAHSGLRYVVLALLIAAVAKAFSGLVGKKSFEAGDNKISLFAMVFCHIQLTIGVILFFVGDKTAAFSNMAETMKDGVLRFKVIEHPVMMLVALALITIGRISSKKQTTDHGKFKKIAVFYGLGLAIILAMIPWPFLKEFGTWF